MKYYCNPINVPYAYSFKKEPRDNFKLTVNREAADPSMVMYGEICYRKLIIFLEILKCRQSLMFQGFPAFLVTEDVLKSP